MLFWIHCRDCGAHSLVSNARIWHTRCDSCGSIEYDEIEEDAPGVLQCRHCGPCHAATAVPIQQQRQK
jgi:translation initiation factor 2 beta subunit (eIF-2beta)/eIF-5